MGIWREIAEHEERIKRRHRESRGKFRGAGKGWLGCRGTIDLLARGEKIMISIGC